mgnify:CR=1 FL=1
MNAEQNVLKAKDAPDLGSSDWADPFRLSDPLDEAERMIQASAAAYASDKLAPRVIAASAHEVTDPDIIAEMAQVGQLRGHSPEAACDYASR